jgi:hypothetical protein
MVPGSRIRRGRTYAMMIMMVMPRVVVIVVLGIDERASAKSAFAAWSASPLHSRRDHGHGRSPPCVSDHDHRASDQTVSDQRCQTAAQPKITSTTEEKFRRKDERDRHACDPNASVNEKSDHGIRGCEPNGRGRRAVADKVDFRSRTHRRHDGSTTYRMTLLFAVSMRAMVMIVMIVVIMRMRVRVGRVIVLLLPARIRRQCPSVSG